MHSLTVVASTFIAVVSLPPLRTPLISGAIASTSPTPLGQTTPLDASPALPTEASAPPKADSSGSGLVASRKSPPAKNSSAPSSGATPASANPVDDDYTLGGGDRIRIDVFGVPEYSGEFPVMVNGTVNLPLIGSVGVKGMTVKQAASVISTRYAPLLKRSLVTVNLVSARPLRIAVSGEVNRPGSYPIAIEGNKLPSVTNVLQLAGGVTQAANLRQVQVRRPLANGQDKLITLNLWELLQAGNLRQDLVLRDGDSVFVPTISAINLAESSTLAASNIVPDASQPIQVLVIGEVTRPGPQTLTKESKENQSSAIQTTVTQAIQQAGGITQAADIRQIQVKRATRSGTEQTITLNLWQMLESGDRTQDLVLQQGDTVVIPTVTALTPEEATKLASATFSPSAIKVNVVGEVARPGTIEVPPNTPFNQAILTAGGFTKQARQGTVQLLRLNPNGTVVRSTIQTNLSASPNSETNPMLRSGDIIVVERSQGAKLFDALDTVLSPITRIWPLFFIP